MMAGQPFIDSETETASVNARFADAAPLSETRIVKLKLPARVGVPLIKPEVDKASPGGRDPDTTAHE